MDIGDNSFTFYVKSLDIRELNRMRRFTLTQFSTWALDDINILENSSTYSDEFIKHRLSLLPIKVQENDNDLATYTASLNIIETISDIEITTHHFISENITCGVLSGERKRSKGIKDAISFEYSPILYLNKGETLKVSVTARKGCGKKHPKWSPAHAISFFRRDPNLFQYFLETDSHRDPIDVFASSFQHLN